MKFIKFLEFLAKNIFSSNRQTNSVACILLSPTLSSLPLSHKHPPTFDARTQRERESERECMCERERERTSNNTCVYSKTDVGATNLFFSLPR